MHNGQCAKEGEWKCVGGEGSTTNGKCVGNGMSTSEGKCEPKSNWNYYADGVDAYVNCGLYNNDQDKCERVAGVEGQICEENDWRSHHGNNLVPRGYSCPITTTVVFRKDANFYDNGVVASKYGRVVCDNPFRSVGECPAFQLESSAVTVNVEQICSWNPSKKNCSKLSSNQCNDGCTRKEGTTTTTSPQVVCMVNGKVVDESYCDIHSKPTSCEKGELICGGREKNRAKTGKCVRRDTEEPDICGEIYVGKKFRGPEDNGRGEVTSKNIIDICNRTAIFETECAYTDYGCEHDPFYHKNGIERRLFFTRGEPTIRFRYRRGVFGNNLNPRYFNFDEKQPLTQHTADTAKAQYIMQCGWKGDNIGIICADKSGNPLPDSSCDRDGLEIKYEGLMGAEYILPLLDFPFPPDTFLEEKNTLVQCAANLPVPQYESIRRDFSLPKEEPVKKPGYDFYTYLDKDKHYYVKPWSSCGKNTDSILPPGEDYMYNIIKKKNHSNYPSFDYVNYQGRTPIDAGYFCDAIGDTSKHNWSRFYIKDRTLYIDDQYTTKALRGFYILEEPAAVHFGAEWTLDTYESQAQALAKALGLGSDGDGVLGLYLDDFGIAAYVLGSNDSKRASYSPD